MTPGPERSAVVVGRRGEHAARVLAERGIGVVAEQESLEGALELLQRHTPDVLVVELPEAGPERVFALVRAAHATFGALTVIGLTTALDPAFVEEAMRHGVHACVRDGRPD